MNKKNKILIIAPRIAAISETFIYDQILGINDFEVIVCCNQRENENIFNFLNEPIVLGSRPVSLYDRFISKIKRFLRGEQKYSLHHSAEKIICTILKNEKISLIHCHYGVSAITLIPIIRKFDIPIIVTFHGYDASKMLLEEDYSNKLSLFFKLNSYSITVSKNMEVRLLKYNLNIDRNVVIPCGIDTNYFVKINEIKKLGPLILLHSGRVTPKKGVLDLAKVFNEIKELNIVLWIMGDGVGIDNDEYDQLKAYIQEFKLEKKVKLFGAQPSEEVKLRMQQSDIFILNSRVSKDGDMEGLPVSILEAMACGLPVISTYHSGIPEIITNGENGLLVPEFDNIALREAILTLINDSELRKKLSNNALIRSQDFSKEITIEIIQDFYRAVLKNEANNFITN
ncbi:MAG TPA: glycosyltransferase family 4 protein [Saprospiraceae bacterium]|nr:glycosyltransferase family 4 protein [Saprospiraceae bacterium]